MANNRIISCSENSRPNKRMVQNGRKRFRISVFHNFICSTIFGCSDFLQSSSKIMGLKERLEQFLSITSFIAVSMTIVWCFVGLVVSVFLPSISSELPYWYTAGWSIPLISLIVFTVTLVIYQNFYTKNF